MKPVFEKIRQLSKPFLDSRHKPVSLNDMIVKDADKLWRYSKSGFYIDGERFGLSYGQSLERLRCYISEWLFTVKAKEMAVEKLSRREKKKTVGHGR